MKGGKRARRLLRFRLLRQRLLRRRRQLLLTPLPTRRARAPGGSAPRRCGGAHTQAWRRRPPTQVRSMRRRAIPPRTTAHTGGICPGR